MRICCGVGFVIFFQPPFFGDVPRVIVQAASPASAHLGEQQANQDSPSQGGTLLQAARKDAILARHVVAGTKDKGELPYQVEVLRNKTKKKLATISRSLLW